jgi:hypothetical protein
MEDVQTKDARVPEERRFNPMSIFRAKGGRLEGTTLDAAAFGAFVGVMADYGVAHAKGCLALADKTNSYRRAAWVRRLLRGPACPGTRAGMATDRRDVSLHR